MNILITGANGFIGSNISKYLINNTNHKIFGIGRSKKRIDANFNYLECNIESGLFVDKVKEKVSNCDIIIHLAACIDKNDNNEDMINVNCVGTLNIIKLAKEINCKKIIYCSSIPIIGIPKILPITEEHPNNPISLYHASKLMGENIVLMAKKDKISSISLRISSPIGKGMNTKTILPVFLDKCMKGEDIILSGKGMRVQNYIDVRDICEAIQLSIISDTEGICNIASNKSHSNLDLAKICIRETKSTSNIKYSGIEDKEEEFRWEISIQKAKNLLGFNPKYTINESIKDMI